MNRLATIIDEDYEGLLTDWLASQEQDASLRSSITSRDEMKRQSKDFLDELRRGLAHDEIDVSHEAWSELRSYLATLTKRRTALGYTPSETATLILSLKKTLFGRLELRVSRENYHEVMWLATRILDSLALYTTDVYHRDREQLIRRQRDDLMELSAPIISVWDGVLCMPLIGTLDSSRSQVIMEALLTEVADREADVAIIDITAVGTVDTQTAQYLVKTVAAARLMGADCIVSGVGPQIAQTLVHLGVDLGDIVTRATLAAALRTAFDRLKLQVTSR